MSFLADLTNRVAEIDLKISLVQRRSAEEIAALQKLRATLIQAGGLLTPEAESSLAALVKLGLVTIKS